MQRRSVDRLFKMSPRSTILQMTDVHQRSKVDCSLLLWCFQDDILFALWSFAKLATFRASPTFDPLLLSHPGVLSKRFHVDF